MTDGAPPVRARGLVKRYKEVLAVDHVDLNVQTGDVYGFLGPNGAGKTTTVEILEGYRTRSAGEVSVLGHDPAARQLALRKRIGIVPSAAPGAQSARKIMMEPVANRLFFAGEAVHETLWGTVGGAWESGERAADAVVKLLGGPSRRG